MVCVEIDPEPRVPYCEGWWNALIAAVGGEASVIEARAEYEAAVKKQRVMW